jgi:hypothetical protein
VVCGRHSSVMLDGGGRGNRGFLVNIRECAKKPMLPRWSMVKGRRFSCD